MQTTFEDFIKGKNRTNYPPTDKFPNGYVMVMISQDEYENIQAQAVQNFIDKELANV